MFRYIGWGMVISLCVVALLLFFGYERAEAPYRDSSNEVLLVHNLNTMSLILRSSAFAEGESIPSQYTCDGDNTLPPLFIEGAPEGTVSFVLVMDDSDIPQEVKDAMGIEKFDHLALYNIPADTTEIRLEEGGSGVTGRGSEGYVGPCPPSQYEPQEHRYIFRLYAVSGILNFIKAPTLDELELAAQGMMLEKAELMGRYKRISE